MDVRAASGLKLLPLVEGRVGEGGLRTKGSYKTSLPGKPLITVISVVLNRVHCFEACIQSVINQSYGNVEFIVIDGGSTDGTVELLRRYDDRIDYWVSEPDKGLYYAMNKAISVAAGDWVNFIGSDDIFLDCLPEMVPKFVDNETIYYGNVYAIGQKRIYNGSFSNYKIYAMGIKHQGMFFPKRVFLTLHYDVTYRIGADWDLCLRCYLGCACHFCYIPELVAVYNDVDGISSKDTKTVWIEYRSYMLKRLGFIGLFFIGRQKILRILEWLHCKEHLKRFVVKQPQYSKDENVFNAARKLIKAGVRVEDVKVALGVSTKMDGLQLLYK